MKPGNQHGLSWQYALAGVDRETGAYVFELPVPISANRMVRSARGRTYRDHRYEEYLVAIQQWARAMRIRPIPATHDVSVEVTWVRDRKAGDLDNRVATVLDALQGVAYQRDSQVVEITARREDKSPTNPARVIVRVRALAAAEEAA